MAAIASNGTGGGLWSDTATWVGAAVPVDGDSVTIALGDTVTFDVDQSGFATGIIDLQCAGDFVCSTTAGTYHLKIGGGGIWGVGGFRAGTAETPLPSSVQFNIEFNGAYQFSGMVGIALYCTDPSIKYVRSTKSVDSAGASSFNIDTDVTGDIWKSGDTIRICDINQTRESEEYVINSITSSTLDITGTLSVQKSSYPYIVLCSRNIKIYSSSINYYMIYNCQGSIFQCEIYGGNTIDPTMVNSTNGFNACTNISVTGGCIHGCSRAIYNSNYASISNIVIAGAYYGIYQGYRTTVNNTCIFSCYYARYSSTGGSNTSILYAGCAYGISTCYGMSLDGIIEGCGYAIYQIYGGYYSGEIINCSNAYYNATCLEIATNISYCYRGIYNCNSINLYSITISNNNYDIDGGRNIIGYNCSLNGTTQCYGYLVSPIWEYYDYPVATMYDIGGVSDSIKGWTRAGYFVSDVAIYPSGLSSSVKFYLQNHYVPMILDWEYSLSDGEELSLTVYLKRDAVTTYYSDPEYKLFEAKNDPKVLPLATMISENTTAANSDWQSFNISYTATGPEKVVLRVQSSNDSGNFWAQAVRNVSSGGTSYDGPACPKTVSGAMYPRMS